MPLFQDPEAARRARERLQALSDGILLDPLFEGALEGNAAPDRAITNLERWLRATGSPRLHLEQVVSVPGAARSLLTLLGASQPIADSLIQNPEFGSLLFELDGLGLPPSPKSLLQEGRRLLASATSNAHALDRLRYLKQRHNLPIVVQDLSGAWPQETVWRALSDLADAIVQLAIEATWPPFARQKNLPEACPVMVVAFGKLGGHEVNYSSDIDLAYVLQDGLDERIERECGRWCESLGRALSDRMGRGSLYRVDLRLRPYGAAGPILRSMKAYEAYYRLYAEGWEVQALLRSRAIAGADMSERWNALVQEIAFRPHLSEAALDAMVAMRRRIEEHAEPDDLKRGPGGIRDIEFLTQSLQMAHGHGHPELQVKPTCDAVRALAEAHIVEGTVAHALIGGYTFLRKLEHRLQLVGDQQTHTMPSDPAKWEGLAQLMGLRDAAELRGSLAFHRRTIGTLYRTVLNLEPDSGSEREALARRLGPYGAGLLQWFDVLPQPDAFYASLATNEGSLGRVETILTYAPRLVSTFKASLPLTELLLSGEIEEPTPVVERIAELPGDTPLGTIASAAASAHATLCARWTLTPDFDLNAELTSLLQTVLVHCLRRLCVDFDVIALGSFGTGESGPGSDADLLMLTEGDHRQAESQAQDLLSLVARLHRDGSPLAIDLRLRPEGGKGLLVRTYEGLQAYDLGAMEAWERFALGHARLVSGNPSALALVRHAADTVPLTPERLKELTRMKRRIETERVKPQHVRRDVKLGFGGLNDIEWLVRLSEMRDPAATHAGRTSDLADRLRRVASAGFLNALEFEFLLEAHRSLLDLRNRLWLLDLPSDLVPENPDRLDRLARASGLADGNEFLRLHEATIEGVRRLYLETLERLRA